MDQMYKSDVSPFTCPVQVAVGQVYPSVSQQNCWQDQKGSSQWSFDTSTAYKFVYRFCIAWVRYRVAGS